MVDTNDMPILLVQVLEEFVSRASPDSNVVWDACRSVEFRSRKVSEGMEVYAVDGSSNEAENQLC